MVVNTTFWPLYARQVAPVPIYEKAVWGLKSRSGQVRRRENLLRHRHSNPKFSTAQRVAVSTTLCRYRWYCSYTVKVRRTFKPQPEVNELALRPRFGPQYFQFVQQRDLLCFADGAAVSDGRILNANDHFRP